MSGRKFFVSLSDAADYFATPAILIGDAPWQAHIVHKLPREAEGLLFRRMGSDRHAGDGQSGHGT